MNTKQLQEAIAETKRMAEQFGYFVLNGFLDNEEMNGIAFECLTTMITKNEEYRKHQQNIFNQFPDLIDRYPKVYA